MKRLTEARAGLRRTRETLSNFTPFLKTRRKGLLLALFVLLLETGTSLAQPWPLAVTIDYVLAENSKPPPAFLPGFLQDKAALLAAIAFLIVLIFTLTRTVASFRRFLLQKLGQETVFDMREALYAKVHALGLDYHGKKRTGDTITRVTSDVKEVRTLLVDSVVEVPFHTGALKVAEGLELWPALRKELLAFRRKINLKTAHDSYEHWRDSDHDDLVLAVALACWWARRRDRRPIPKPRGL